MKAKTLLPWMIAMALAAFALSAVRVASAEGPGAGPPAGAAEALFEEGRRALAAGDLDTACARLRASDELDPGVGVRASLAACEERRGNLATAWAVFRSALARATPGDGRAASLQERIGKLEARVPKLVIVLARGAHPETLVHEGQSRIGNKGTYGVLLPLDPGVHHLVVTAPDAGARSFDVTLVEGRTTKIVVRAVDGMDKVEEVDAPPGDASTGAREVRADAHPNGARGRSTTPLTGPLALGGAGLLALVTGAVLGGVVVHERSVVDAHCTFGPPAVCRDQTGMNAAGLVHTLGPATTVSLVLGSAAVAGAGIWLGIDRTQGRQGRPRVGVAYLPNGAFGARAEGTW